MKLLLNTHTANEHGEGCEYAFVNLDKPPAVLILKRAEAFDAAHKTDPSLQEVHYGDSEAVFVDGLPEDFEESVDLQTWQNEAFTEVSAFAKDFENLVARTECDQMVITSQDVYWTCYPERSDWQVETRPIPFETIRAVAG